MSTDQHAPEHKWREMLFREREDFAALQEQLSTRTRERNLALNALERLVHACERVADDGEGPTLDLDEARRTISAIRGERRLPRAVALISRVAAESPKIPGHAFVREDLGDFCAQWLEIDGVERMCGAKAQDHDRR